MQISGFTIIRNAIKFDYPIVEAIQSILPLCDEMIVAVGDSDDNTLELIQSINSPKIKIIHSVWDNSLREGGQVLALETDKAFQAVSKNSDWAFYIQADEVLHEKCIPTIEAAMLKWNDHKQVDGLLFDYKHFYGSYDYVGDSRRWYRKEIRVIRNDKSISSWMDAISFRRNRNKLNVKPIDACLYHYGWVKPPSAQQEKQKSFHKMWHHDEWMQKNISSAHEFDYSKMGSLQKFSESHPVVMHNRIQSKNWKFTYDPSPKNISLKNKLSDLVEKFSGWRIGEYKNYKII